MTATRFAGVFVAAFGVFLVLFGWLLPEATPTTMLFCPVTLIVAGIMTLFASWVMLTEG